MLCQRPIVATATDGALELLNSNLVEIRQSDALANMIINVLNSQRNAVVYLKAKNFDWKHILIEWINLYKSDVE